MDVEGKGNPGLGKDPGVGTRTRGLSVSTKLPLAGLP